MAGAPSAGGGGALAVLTVYFGPLPPWLPITLHSMAANPRVSFAVVGDAPPPARLPPNVRFVTTPYAEMQARGTVGHSCLRLPRRHRGSVVLLLFHH